MATLFTAACGGGGGGGAGSQSESSDEVDLSTQSENENIEMARFAFAMAGNDNVDFNTEYNNFSFVASSNKTLAKSCNNKDGTYDIPDGPLYTHGDYIFVNCVLGSVTLDGNYNISASTLSDFKDKMTFSGFSVEEAGEKLTSNGVMHISDTSTSGIDTYKITTDGNKVTIDYLKISTGNTDSIGLIVDSTSVDNTSTQVETYDAEVIVTSTKFTGSFTFKTITTIEHNYGLDPYPFAGSFKVTGKNGGNILVSIQGSGAATGIINFQIDKDGDGVYESSIDKTWAEFDA